MAKVTDFSFNKYILSRGADSGLMTPFENLEVSTFLIILLCLLLACCKAIKRVLFSFSFPFLSFHSVYCRENSSIWTRNPECFLRLKKSRVMGAYCCVVVKAVRTAALSSVGRRSHRGASLDWEITSILTECVEKPWLWF